MNSPNFRSRWPIGLLVAGYAVVLAAVLWTETDTGTLEVRLDGKLVPVPVNVPVEQGDKVLSIFGPTTGTRLTLYSGDYRLSLQNPSGKYRLDTASFHIDRGATVVANVTTVP